MTFYLSISVYICDFILPNIPSFKMNTSSWRKAANLVVQGTQANQQVQAAAMAESNQLESLPRSALSADDSSPLQVTYGSEQPLAASTPRATSTSIPEMQTPETYHQIIPLNLRLICAIFQHFGQYSLSSWTHRVMNCSMSKIYNR